jgi:hypothetical protein
MKETKDMKDKITDYFLDFIKKDEVKKELASMATYKHEMTPQAEEMLENLLTRKVKTFEMYYNG